MLTINDLRPIVAEALASQNAFLVDLHLSMDGRIQVYTDLEVGHISIQSLKMINRAVESALGDDSEQYGIEVSSPGMFSPFKVESQYRKAIGRTFIEVFDREAHRIQGVEFLGLNTRDGLAAAKAFNDRFKTSYPSIRDKDGQLTLVFGNLGPAATPSTIILDSQGRVAARILGPTTESELRVVLTAVLEGEK